MPECFPFTSTPVTSPASLVNNLTTLELTLTSAPSSATFVLNFALKNGPTKSPLVGP